MTVEENQLRVRIVSGSQHPYRHSLRELAFVDEAMPGVTNAEEAIRWFSSVIYPQALDSVATPGDLPAVGNTLNDYRVVRDDGDGRAAGYRWMQLEGAASASWHKIYDMDWGVDSVLTALYQKTQDLYVSHYGFDDTDEDGVALTGINAGQHIYGGKSASTHLTLHANAGDGVGSQTGYVQMADNVRPTVDSSWSLGTTAYRWLKVWTDELTVGTMTLTGSGQITDTDGSIDFDNEDLFSTGEAYLGACGVGDGSAAVPTFFFQSDPDTGFYYPAAAEIGVSLGGSLAATFASGGLSLADGFLASPSLRWGDASTGFYRSGLDEVALAIDGTQRLKVSTLGAAWSTDAAYVDFSSKFFGVGTDQPATTFHGVGSGAGLRLESNVTNATVAPVIELYRGRASGADLAALDELGYIDAYGIVSGSQSWLSGIQARYRGDGTTRRADWIFSTANLSAPAERMRIRYDGNVGIGETDPNYTLHVVGTAGVDNLHLDGNTISTTDTNGDLILDPNGTGFVDVRTGVFPGTDDVYNLGKTANRWSRLYLSDAISDGTTEIESSVLQSLRDINTGVGAGYSLFWNGTKWTSSLPDTEVDHGGISGLSDDDHTQYALLAGRSGGQTLNGGMASGDDLYLVSTSHSTKGNLFTTGSFAPTSDGVYDFGAAGAYYKDAYIAGQLYGARLQNATTAGRPAASAGTKGRLIWDTDLEDVYVDKGGTWKKVGMDKYVNQDATTWNGTAYTQTYTVSADIDDARTCIWVFKNNSNSFEQEAAKITMTQTAVTVTFPSDMPPAAGTYTLIGIG